MNYNHTCKNLYDHQLIFPSTQYQKNYINLTRQMCLDIVKTSQIEQMHCGPSVNTTNLHTGKYICIIQQTNYYKDSLQRAMMIFGRLIRDHIFSALITQWITRYDTMYKKHMTQTNKMIRNMPYPPPPHKNKKQENKQCYLLHDHLMNIQGFEETIHIRHILHF